MTTLKVLNLALALGLTPFATLAVAADEVALPSSSSDAAAGPDFAKVRQAIGHSGRKNEVQLIREIMNPDQLKQLDPIISESVTKMKSMIAELRQLQQQPDAPDDAIRAKQIEELQRKLVENRAKSREKMLSLLTPEQKDLLKQKKADQPHSFHIQFDNDGNVVKQEANGAAVPVSSVQPEKKAKP